MKKRTWKFKQGNKTDEFFEGDEIDNFFDNSNNLFENSNIDGGILVGKTSLLDAFDDILLGHGADWVDNFQSFVEYKYEHELDDEKLNVKLIYKENEKQFYEIDEEGIENKLITITEKEYEVMCKISRAFDCSKYETFNHEVEGLRKGDCEFIDKIVLLDTRFLNIEEVEKQLLEILQRKEYQTP